MAIDLVPEMLDEGIHGVGCGVMMHVPDLLDDRGPQHDLSSSAGEKFEKLIFLCGKYDLAIAAADASCQRIYLQISDLDRAYRRRLMDAAERRDPREQLVKIKRLCQVLIGAAVEPDYFVFGRVPRRQQQRRRRDSARSKVAADLSPVDIRQHNVQDQNIVRV